MSPADLDLAPLHLAPRELFVMQQAMASFRRWPNTGQFLADPPYAWAAVALIARGFLVEVEDAIPPDVAEEMGIMVQVTADTFERVRDAAAGVDVSRDRPQ